MNDKKKKSKQNEVSNLPEFKSSSNLKKNAKSAFIEEADQVFLRNEIEDTKLHDEAIQTLQAIIKEIHVLKNQPNSASQIDELRTQGLLHFMMLKKLNRVNHFRSKHVREITNEAKQKSEAHYLKLQNLLYEILHFEKEISKCLQFRSEDEDIVLIPEQEFFENAPVEISKPEITKTDGHQLSLARLHWELEERKRLSQRLNEISSERENMHVHLESKRKYLNDLKPMLMSILNATQPIQEQLNMPYDKIRQLHEKASHLPPSLYALYLQVEALSIRDKTVTAGINGDWNADADADDLLNIFEDDSDSDDELEKKHHRRSTSESQLLQKKERLFRKHPLAVFMEMTSNEMKLTLTFQYFTSLNIVTLHAKVDIPETHTNLPASASDLFDGESLLVLLYADDEGVTTPNPNNLYFLKELGLNDIGDALGRENGRAYKWVQNLCGLQFLDPKANISLKDDETDLNEEAEEDKGLLLNRCLHRLKKRMKNRASLVKQLASLENNVATLNHRNVNMFPARIVSTLKQWKRITYSSYIAKACNQKIVEHNLVSKSDYIFSGIIERKFSLVESQMAKSNEAILTFYAVLNVNYPSMVPTFTFVVSYNGEHSALNNENIREMESAVNFDWSQNQVDDLILTNQVLRLELCFDVYLECTLRGFAGEKMLIRRHKGRCRSLPFNYDPQLKIYTQRNNYSNNSIN